MTRLEHTVMRLACAVLVLGLVAVSRVPAAAQTDADETRPTVAPAAVLPTINYRERPRFPFDAQRLKLRPVLDGVISPNEWTPLYTVGDGLVKGTVYMNWDDDFVYIGAQTDTRAWLAVDVDANGDGWLRGSDNVEAIIAPLGATGTAPVAVRILDAASNKDAPVWNDKVVDPQTIKVVLKEAGSGQVVEIAIPKGTAGLLPRTNAQVSLRVDLLPADAKPTATPPFEPHLLLDVVLVDSRVVSAPGIGPRLVLDDAKLVPGQVFKASLELSNQVDEERSIRTVSWQGEGAALDILKSVREVSIAPLLGLKTMKLRYQSPLPDTTVPGFYQFTVTAQMDAGGTVSTTTSFQVVEPYAVSLTCEPESATVIGPTPVKVVAEIDCFAPGYSRADVEIELPAGWTLKGKPVRKVDSPRPESHVRVPFQVTIPSATQAGEYMVNLTLTWRGRTWKAHRAIKVTRPAEPK